MPRINVDAKSKRDLLADKANGYINWALDTGGKKRGSTLRELARRYPSASKSTIESVYDHVIESREAGRRLSEKGDDGRISAASMPSNPGLPMRYRYTVYIRWQAGSRASEEGFYALVDLDHNATQSEVGSLAFAQTLNEIRAAKDTHWRYPSTQPKVDKFSFVVVNVEKRAR